MTITETSTLTQEQKEAIRTLWNAEYPARIGHSSASSFEQYLGGLSGASHHLLQDDETILGWAVRFVRDDEVWFAIILYHTIRGSGWGTQLLDKLKAKEPVLNGWVIDHDNDVKQNGEPYPSPLGFYLKNGFITLPSTRIETEQISAVKIRWERG